MFSCFLQLLFWSSGISLLVCCFQKWEMTVKRWILIPYGPLKHLEVTVGITNFYLLCRKWYLIDKSMKEASWFSESKDDMLWGISTWIIIHSDPFIFCRVVEMFEDKYWVKKKKNNKIYFIDNKEKWKFLSF